MAKNLTKNKIIEALESLDSFLKEPVKLIIGGGGALVCAYKFPLATEDLDAYSTGTTPEKLDFAVKKVAKALSLEPDWLNPYFSTFAYVLPGDYSSRLKLVYKGKHCEAYALGPEDLLLMKCFAGRDKDIPHARALLKEKGILLEIIEDRIQELIEKRVVRAKEALAFFDDLTKDL
jgi:hypothetical protein